MPIPSNGPIVTPSGFAIQSLQGQVSLSWNAGPQATIYYISRSTDGITFTELGTTAALFYNDTTGVVDTIYYYYLQSGNGTYSSLPTNALTGISLTPGQTTLGNLRTQVLQRTDLTNDPNIGLSEANQYVSDSYKWLYNLVLQKFGNDYFIGVPFYITTTGILNAQYQAQVFALPPDFYKLARCEVALNPSDPNSWITLQKFEAIQANLYNYPNQYTFYGITNLRYRLWGNFLHVVPVSAAGQTIRLWYSPRPNQLINDTDIIDGVADWEELIVVDAAIKMLTKQESDPSVFVLQKQEMLKMLNEAAENRDVSLPEKVSDARRRNFAWGDSDEGGNYGGC
jgi:hypothetical protein